MGARVHDVTRVRKVARVHDVTRVRAAAAEGAEGESAARGAQLAAWPERFRRVATTACLVEKTAEKGTGNENELKLRCPRRPSRAETRQLATKELPATARPPAMRTASASETEDEQQQGAL